MNDRENMERLVQTQAEAYNRRDLDAFCACYHPDVHVYRNLGEPTSLAGIADFRRSYKERFNSSPNLQCEIRSRITLSKTIVDEEVVSGLSGSKEPLHVVAIYGFQDGLISQVWFAR